MMIETDINARGYEGKTILHFASMFRSGNENVTLALVRLGADVNVKDNVRGDSSCVHRHQRNI